jgi:hypothetical protein
MLPEVRVVPDCCCISEFNLELRRTGLTLLGSQEPELISCTSVVWVALAVVAVLQNDSDAVELLHQDLYDCNCQQRNISPMLENDSLPVWRFENRLSPLVSPPIYRNTGPPGL